MALGSVAITPTVMLLKVNVGTPHVSFPAREEERSKDNPVHLLQCYAR
jgi:hypothetical protein